MNIRLYCFVDDCQCGILDIHDDFKEFTWYDDSRLSKLAKTYKKYANLGSTQDIDIFISERVIDRINRPDAGMWLLYHGLNLNSTNDEVFVAIHGVSLNDKFWFDTDKNSRFYDEVLKDR